MSQGHQQPSITGKSSYPTSITLPTWLTVFTRLIWFMRGVKRLLRRDFLLALAISLPFLSSPK